VCRKEKKSEKRGGKTSHNYQEPNNFKLLHRADTFLPDVGTTKYFKLAREFLATKTPSKTRKKEDENLTNET